MPVWLWCLVTFIAGVIVGFSWREAYELFRRQDEMSRVRLLLAIHRTTLLMWALIVAMVFTGLVGVTVLVDNNSRSNLIDCVTAYNRQSGAARDERNTAADKVAIAQLEYVRQDLRYQEGLLTSLRGGRSEGTVPSLIGVIRTRIAANRAYLKTLTDQQKVRAAHDFPPPDLCETP